MASRLSLEQLANLRTGRHLWCVFKAGSQEFKHPAIFRYKEHGQLHILVKFTDKPQRKIRWSLITNRPVGESRGFSGTARLELAEPHQVIVAVETFDKTI